MNVEKEVKSILENGGTPEQKAENISKFTNFKKKNIIKAIKMGGENVSIVYGNLILMQRHNK